MRAFALVPVTLLGVRQRPMTLVGPMAAIAFSVAAAVVALSVLVCAASAADRAPVRYRAADVVVALPLDVTVPVADGETERYRPADPRGLTGADVERLGRLAGGAAMVADHASRGGLLVDGGVFAPADEVMVRGWASRRLSGAKVLRGDPPGPGEVAVPPGRGLDVGDRATLLTPGGTRLVTVTALVEDAGADGEVSVLVDDAEAARLAHGLAAAVGFFTSGETPGEPGALRARLAGGFTAAGGAPVLVLTGVDRARAETDRRATMLEDTVSLAGVVMMVSGLVAIFTTANTFALGMTRRRGEFALLRLVGATRRQVRTGVLLEALVVAALGTVPGLLLGALLTPVFSWLLVRNGLAPDGFAARPTGWVLFGASGVAVLVALLAARSASRRAGKVRPVVAAAEAGADTRRPGVFRLLFGLACLAGAAIVPFLLPAGLEVVLAGAVMLSWLALIGLSALGPFIVPRVAGALLWLGSVPGRLVGRPAPLGELPRASSRRAVRRTTAIAMPVAVCVGLAATLLGITGMAVAGSGREAASLVTADQVVLAGPAGTIDAAVARSFADLDGVAAAVPLRRTEVMAGSQAETYERPAWLVDPDRLAQVTALPVSAGDVRELRPGTIALGRALARSMGGLDVGDTAHFWGPDGRKAEATVVALLDLPMLSVEALLPFPGEVVADQVLVSFDQALSGTALAGARDAVDARAAEIGAASAPAAAVESQAAAEQEQGNRLAVRIILAIAVLLGAVTVANTVVMSIEDRRGETAALRLLGADDRHVRRWLLTECAGVLLAGLVLGLLVYAVTGLPMVLHQPELGPWLAPPVVDVWVVGGFLAAIAVASTLLGPGRFRSR